MEQRGREQGKEKERKKEQGANRKTKDIDIDKKAGVVKDR